MLNNHEKDPFYSFLPESIFFSDICTKDNLWHFNKSSRLENLKYAIRGPVFDKAQEMQAAGIDIINLNIGNPAPFGFNVPDEIKTDIILNIRKAQGYSHHLGIFPARKAVMQYCQQTGIKDVKLEDVFIGNGVSELIVMSMQALLNEGDEILIPSPDYPLWTSAVRLPGGNAVHYSCDEANNWQPNIEDIKSKITPQTKGIVVINPNNPTGAVYSKELLIEIKSLAEKYKLIVCSDEIYDKILYDDTKHHAICIFGQRNLVPYLWRFVQKLPCSRISCRLVSIERSNHSIQILHRRPYLIGLHVAVCQRTCPTRHTNCSWWIPKYQRSRCPQRQVIQTKSICI